jgi:hypothetical protein
MAKATDCHNTLLSDLTADPTLQRFFRRGPGSESFLILPTLRNVPPLSGLVREEASHA